MISAHGWGGGGAIVTQGFGGFGIDPSPSLEPEFVSKTDTYSVLARILKHKTSLFSGYSPVLASRLGLFEGYSTVHKLISSSFDVESDVLVKQYFEQLVQTKTKLNKKTLYMLLDSVKFWDKPT